MSELRKLFSIPRNEEKALAEKSIPQGYFRVKKVKGETVQIGDLGWNRFDHKFGTPHPSRIGQDVRQLFMIIRPIDK